MVETGAVAPNFTLPASDGSQVTLADYRGKWVVLYFYPKDLTPGCTTQACDFRDYSPKFAQHGVVVFGVSRDRLVLHEKFVSKHDLPFLLLSDEEGTVCEQFDVLKYKNLFGKTIFGIERATFVIDPVGKIAQIYRKVRVKNHVQQVLQFIREQGS
jgi:thioredoxin-dependent peroxiredoxin